jgi:predicted phosphate transport protein (TIGR00153 family)
MIFGRKESDVKDLIRNHLSAVDDCLGEFDRMIDCYLEGDDRYEEFSYGVHEEEQRADEIRRQIEQEIYEGAFMPLFREDYITLVELADRVANRAETVSDIIAQQSPEVPEDMRADLKELSDTVLTCFDPLVDVIGALDKSWEETHEIAQQVEELEQEVDKIERRLIEELFDRTDMELAEKLQIRDIIQLIASIADRMEDTSDRVDIMLIKRKV